MTDEPEGRIGGDGDTRAGFVALIGEPNAGKSTLLNRMVGAKVSIVTHKVQTTRARIRGVAMEGQAQIVFVDTPGLFRPRRRLDRAMVAAAWGVAGAAATRSGRRSTTSASRPGGKSCGKAAAAVPAQNIRCRAAHTRWEGFFMGS